MLKRSRFNTRSVLARFHLILIVVSYVHYVRDLNVTCVIFLLHVELVTKVIITDDSLYFSTLYVVKLLMIITIKTIKMI